MSFTVTLIIIIIISEYPCYIYLYGVYNINKITIESSIVEHQINILATNIQNRIQLINHITQFTKIEILDPNNGDTIIVLWFQQD